MENRRYRSSLKPGRMRYLTNLITASLERIFEVFTWRILIVGCCRLLVFVASAKNKMAKREKNFSSSEEHTLVILIKEKYADIVENKKTDAGSNKDKKKAWENVAREFNSLSGSEIRSAESLRNKYINLKKMSKKKYADNKMLLFKTGGGGYSHIELNDTDVAIQTMLGEKATGYSSQFDSDTTCVNAIEIEEMSIQTEEKEMESSPKRLRLENISTDIVKCADSEEAHFPRPIHSSPKKKPTTVPPKDLRSKLGDWAKEKEREQRQKQDFAVEIHNLKIKQMREQHEIDIRIKKEEHEQKMRHYEEEHQLKLEMLRFKYNNNNTSI